MYKLKETKTNSTSIESFKKKLSIDESYHIEEQHFTNQADENTKQVYKVSKDGSNVGILATKDYYFVFDYDKCCDGQNLDMNKVNGWVANVHGIRNPITDHPFSPEGNNWNVNFLGPMGSILMDGYFYSNEELSSLKSYGKWSKDEHGNVNQTLYQKDQEGNNNQKGLKHGKKYEQETKQVGGSITHPDKMMNITISPTTKKQGMNIDNVFSQISNSSMGAGFIYARHGGTDLKTMLSDVNDLDASKNVALSVCRGGFEPNIVEKKWYSKDNNGPYIVDELQTLRLHDIAKQAPKHHRDELIEKAKEIIKTNPEQINQIDKEGRTPLYCALSSQNYQLAGILMENGANYGNNNMLNLMLSTEINDDLCTVISNYYNGDQVNLAKANQDFIETVNFAILLNKPNEISKILDLNIPCKLTVKEFEGLVTSAENNHTIKNILMEHRTNLCDIKPQNPVLPFSSFESLNERGSVNDVEPLH
ncbi:hypothetical protein L3V83_06610 [Thiotrichales bacterium 19X7-9]|nr:hypothetical protein [Thiotrichales bacterium 19X7-9]